MNVVCADGMVHCGPGQCEMFGLKRLVKQANRNGCGPHRLVSDDKLPSKIRSKD